MNPNEYLEPRKQVRVCPRRDLIITAQAERAPAGHIVKDPISLRYWRFGEHEFALLQLLDGRTLAEVQAEFEKRFRPERLSLERIEAFAQHLVTSGLVHPGSVHARRGLVKRGREQSRARKLGALRNFFAIRVPLFDPDALLRRMLPWFRWVFTTSFFLLSVGVMFAATLLVATHFDAFCDKLPSAREFFHWNTLLSLGLALAAVKVVHEFGHGLSCKAFGGEVHEMGALLLCFVPSLYCDVTDAWQVPGRWRRIVVSFAGVYVELLIAALATFVWWNTAGPGFIRHLCLSLIVVCSVNTLVFNGNPLMRYDGYYMLADWLEVPNLQERARATLHRWLLLVVFGIQSPPRPGSGWAWLVVYALASMVYRWIVTASVLWLMYRFLEPYRLGSLGAALAGLTVASLLLTPLLRILRQLRRRRGAPSMRWTRALVTVGALAAALAGFWLVPLPVSRVRQVGLVEVQPTALEKVFVQEPGVLDRLHVHEGQRVEKGELLAEFRSLDLEQQLADALAEQEIRAVRLQAMREVVGLVGESAERDRIEGRLARAAGDLARAARQVDLTQKLLGRLQVRAPRAGVVMELPRVEALGKFWATDTSTPLCAIGDPGCLWALVPLNPSEQRLLKEDMDEARRRGTELVVRARVIGRPGPVWDGHVVQLPESEVREVPKPLTQAGGGPVALKPGDGRRAPVPQNQQYFVGVALDRVDGAVWPGNLAQVSIHCQWRTGAWWLRRTLASVFDWRLY